MPKVAISYISQLKMF